MSSISEEDLKKRGKKEIKFRCKVAWWRKKRDVKGSSGPGTILPLNSLPIPASGHRS
jgi:hypothetical protein